MSNAGMGRKKSEETKKKMSKARKRYCMRKKYPELL